MLPRVIIAIIALIELIAPKQFARFWLGWCCSNPDEIELRGWVSPAIRLEGLLLLGWVVWQSKEDIEQYADLSAFDPLSPPDVEVHVDEGEDTATESEQVPTLQRGTTRYDLAAALGEAEEPLPVSTLVERSSGTDWEVGRSTASATLYRMHRDGLVKRREREDARGYAYWLSDAGTDALSAAESSVEAN